MLMLYISMEKFVSWKVDRGREWIKSVVCKDHWIWIL